MQLVRLYAQKANDVERCRALHRRAACDREVCGDGRLGIASVLDDVGVGEYEHEHEHVNEHAYDHDHAYDHEYDHSCDHDHV